MREKRSGRCRSGSLRRGWRRPSGCGRGVRGAPSRLRCRARRLRQRRLLRLDAAVPVRAFVGAIGRRRGLEVQFVIAGRFVNSRAHSDDVAPFWQSRADPAFPILQFLHVQGHRITPLAIRPELDSADELNLLRHHAPQYALQSSASDDAPLSLRATNGSAAISSVSGRDCFVATLLAMTRLYLLPLALGGRALLGEILLVDFVTRIDHLEQGAAELAQP